MKSRYYRKLDRFLYFRKLSVSEREALLDKYVAGASRRRNRKPLYLQMKESARGYGTNWFKRAPYVLTWVMILWFLIGSVIAVLPDLLGLAALVFQMEHSSSEDLIHWASVMLYLGKAFEEVREVLYSVWGASLCANALMLLCAGGYVPIGILLGKIRLSDYRRNVLVWVLELLTVVLVVCVLTVGIILLMSLILSDGWGDEARAILGAARLL